MNEQEFIEKYAARTASFRADTFRPLLNEAFVYRDASGTAYKLRLTKVEEGRGIGDLFESFTLVFASPKSVNFAQGYYLLEHAGNDEFPMFLIPAVTLDTEHNYCCAYFSIRKQAAG